MGRLTRSEIITQGLALAGNSALSDGILVAFQAALDRVYDEWPWPFTLRDKTGIPLTAGTATLSFGNATNTSSNVAARVARINDPMKLSNGTYNFRGVVRIRTRVDADLQRDENLGDPTQNRAAPTLCRVVADESISGRWTLQFWPIPERDYTLKINYQTVPPALAADTDIPVYPNDATLIQLVKVLALDYMKRPEYPGEMQVYRGMVASDRMNDGQVPGTNDVLPLDNNVFR
jgi:hypothetical protein